MRLGSLFSGYGGLDMAVGDVLGARPVWHCDVDPDAARLLAHRWPSVPNLGDITTVDWTRVESVEVITGGFPCQDVSTAGRRAGLIRGATRTGLWACMLDAIDALRPRWVVAENVRGLLSAKADSHVEPCPGCLGATGREPAVRALGAVLGDLADIGYDAAWRGLRASDVGAPHSRFRIFLLAWPATHTRRTPRRHRDHTAPHPAGHAAHLLGACGDAEAGRWPIHLNRAGGLRAPGGPVGWGQYARAIERWERVTGRPAPAPVVLIDGGLGLSPRFVEWLMGVADGHVTAAGLTRDAQLRMLGNGVVPQQGAVAVASLLTATALAGRPS